MGKWCQNSGQRYHGNIHCTYYTTEMMSKLWSMIPWKYTLYLLYNRNDVKTLVKDTMEIYIVLIIQQKWCQNSGSIFPWYLWPEFWHHFCCIISTMYISMVSLTRVLTSFTRVLTSFLLYNKYNVYFHGIIDQSFDIISVV
jgi:hypothetical protein